MLRGRKVRQRPQSWSSVSTKPESHQNLNTLLPLHHNTQIVAARFKTVNTCAAIRFKQAPHRRQHSDDCKRVLWRIFPQCDRFFLCSAIVKISVVTTFLLLLVVQWAEPNAFSPRRRKLSVLSIAHNFQLSFPVQKTKLPKSFFNLPAPFDDLQRRVSSFRHHGGLHIETNVKFSDSGILSTREISQDYRDTLGYEALVSPAEVNNESDDVQGYYAFDDDLKRDPHADFDHVDTGGRPKCRRTSWHRDLPINCNNLHEFDVENRFLVGETNYLGKGAFREVYLAKMPAETVVFKAYYWGASFDYADFEYMRMDALISEKLTGSDKIVDIYGFCGTGMINEAMVDGDVERVVSPLGHLYTYVGGSNESRLPVVKNSLSGSQKLQYALEMAEAVAVLHSYPKGAIVHDDIQISQFLLTRDGHLKLNDFNRAEVMLWDDGAKEYCRYRNDVGTGGWRSPEEYINDPLDEKIDVWSLGNNFYLLLTGLKPHYELSEFSDIKKQVVLGTAAFIDPLFQTRSFGDSKLSEIIRLCWKHDPDDRINIFDLVKLLQSVVQANVLLSDHNAINQNLDRKLSKF